MSALVTVTWKGFNGKFTVKIDFPIGYVMLPLLMLTSEVQSFTKYLDHMPVKFEQIVWSELHKILSFLTIWLTSKSYLNLKLPV